MRVIKFMSDDNTSQLMKKAAESISKESGESVEKVIINFIASTLITDSKDPCHVDGIRFAQKLEEVMTHLFVKSPMKEKSQMDLFK